MTETPQNAEPINIPQFINELFFVRCDQYFSQNAQVSERKENEVLFLMPVSILFQHRSLSSLPHRAVLEAVKAHPQLCFIPSQEDLDEIEKESVRYSIEIRMQTEKQTFMVKVDCDEDTSVDRLTEELTKLHLSASKTEETQSKRGFFVYFENKKTADESLQKFTHPFSATLLTSPPPTLSSFSKFRRVYNSANLSGAKGPSNLFIPGQQSSTQTQSQNQTQTQTLSNTQPQSQQMNTQTQIQTQTLSQPQSQSQPQTQMQPQALAVPGLFYPNHGFCYGELGTQPNTPARVVFSDKPFYSQSHSQQMSYGQHYQQRQNYGQNSYRQNRQNQNQGNQNQNQNQNSNSNRYNRKKGKGNNRMKNKRNGVGNGNSNQNNSNLYNPNDKRDNMPKRSVETNSSSFPPLSHNHNVGSGYEGNVAVKKYSITETQKIMTEQFAVEITEESSKPSLILMPEALCVSQKPLQSLFSEHLAEKTDPTSLTGSTTTTTKAKTGTSYADIMRASSPAKNVNAILSSSSHTPSAYSDHYLVTPNTIANTSVSVSVSSSSAASSSSSVSVSTNVNVNAISIVDDVNESEKSVRRA